MSASLSILSSSSWRPACRHAYPAYRCPASYPPLKSIRLRCPELSSLPFLLRLPSRASQGFAATAADDGTSEPNEGSVVNDEVAEARGRSTLPDRFRHLTKEVPDRPVRWPWLIALVFLAYTWRAVLWELYNWKTAALSIVRFVGYISKLLLALVFPFIGPPITALLWCIDFTLNFTRSIYSGVVAFAPVPELLWIIVLTSAVMAVSEATVPDSLSSQPYLLTVAGLVGYGAVGDAIPELLFWLVLLGMFCYAKFIKKQDNVSAALSPAAVLAAVGQPWVRAITMLAYLSLAIVQHSKSSAQQEATPTITGKRPPFPLLMVALAIGIHLAAKWVRHRHLTWMIVGKTTGA